MWIIQIKSWKSKDYHNTIIIKARAAHKLQKVKQWILIKWLQSGDALQVTKGPDSNPESIVARQSVNKKNYDSNNQINFCHQNLSHPHTFPIPRKYCYLHSSFKISITAPLSPFIFYLLYYLEFRVMQKAKPVSSLYLLLWVLRAD